MNWVHPTALLIGTWLVVFAQTAIPGMRELLHVQPDLLPALVVYAALYGNLSTTAVVAVLGGLGSDSLSSGPFGLGAVPLLLLGVLLHRRRDVILRDSTWAQASLGGAATAGVWAATFLLLTFFWPFLSAGGSPGAYLPELREGLGAPPEPGLGRLWQGFVVALTGCAATPVVFRVFRWIDAAFNYQPAPIPMHRHDREIERGRS